MGAVTRKRVLWVDDEIEFLRAHIMFLETRGYSVIPVFSGDDAITLIREKPNDFDIVLLDEQMPGKDGLTTLEELKEINGALPIVMVTKSEEEQLMEDALGMKIDGYLTKPVNPSQILSVCKSVIDSKRLISSQISQKFIRAYSENKAMLSHELDSRGWMRLYQNLIEWDLELDTVEDEGLRQTHAGLKSDCNARFCQFVAENYSYWIKGNNNPPLFSADIVQQYLHPALSEHKTVFFVVLESMRFDQFKTIEPMLAHDFMVNLHSYFSILPSANPFARTALFAGMYPSELSENDPGMWKDPDTEAARFSRYRRDLLVSKLSELGHDDIKPVFLRVGDVDESKSVLEKIEKMKKARLVVLTVNNAGMLTQEHSSSQVLKEIFPDETSFRALTRSWYQYSGCGKILSAIARKGGMGILTTDHGSVFCSRPTEIYGCRELTRNIRYKFGRKITSDDRRALYLSDPALYRLPEYGPETCCIMARENYYFVNPDKFENYQNQYQNSFQYGGISMDEMIVPLAVMEPR